MEKCLETCGDDGDGASVQSGDCGDGAGVQSGGDGDGDGASVESCDSLYSHPHVAAVPYDWEFCFDKRQTMEIWKQDRLQLAKREQQTVSTDTRDKTDT